MRECTDYAYLFRTLFKDSVKALWEAYGQLFENFKDFKQNFEKITMDPSGHQALVFINNKNSFDESYCGFKAAKVPEFKMVY